jgi:uncharacterized protein YegP (UPF0339 family)
MSDAERISELLVAEQQRDQAIELLRQVRGLDLQRLADVAGRRLRARPHRLLPPARHRTDPRKAGHMTDRVEVFEDKAGQWRWRRRSRNGEVLSQGESHTREADARRAAERANPDLYGTDETSSE